MLIPYFFTSMKRLIFLILLTPVVFAAANLNVKTVDYDKIYSNSVSEIIFSLENTGDETAYLTNNTLSGFNFYTINFAPETIPSGSESEVVFHVKLDCEARGNFYDFFANFSYFDSSNNYITNSSLYSVMVDSPFQLNILQPSDINSLVGIRTDEVDKLLYSLSNNGLNSLNFNVTVSHDDSVFSKILTPIKQYSSTNIENEVFTIQPFESYLFSHSLIPIMSGQTGSYTVIIQDSSCSFNKEIININYQIISSTEGPGFNILIADETNIIIFLIGLIVLIFFYKRELN